MHFSIQTYVSWICGLLTSFEISFIIFDHLIILLVLSFLCVCRPPRDTEEPRDQAVGDRTGDWLISLFNISSQQCGRAYMDVSSEQTPQPQKYKKIDAEEVLGDRSDDWSH